MLAANVLCIKKKKKKQSYHFSENLNTLSIRNDKEKGRRSSTMLHITEDTPADMLSGAMDLTIHLPSGKTTKMCVERSTPMMDLLVQITTNHQLQITNYTLQPLQISPDSSYSEKILSYYPNTPIGALDTQHVRIVPKTKTLPTQKTVPVGHQPFESTFRLKVHLPRNQLFVTRVSRHVHIGDIMRKVCEEKNLDPNKCEVRHPGNFDEVLDPKLTLNDYMITEIYLILKGSNTINQTFSANDIMSLRKEEERKHLHSKTGGGVFNLIFRRGKTNSVSTSTSAPVNSEGSRSVTPPVAPVQEIATPKPETQPEKPRVPQRKRRPAPKPPIPVDKPPNDNAEGKVSSIVSDNSATSDICVKNESSVMICHSRHSSDSSGYHETSILSDHCNTSLPRRCIGLEGDRMSKNLNRHSQSIGNLSKMTEQSRSTSSLAFAGRKKKAAPPPPKFLQDSSSSKPATQKPSPLVASQTPVDYNQSNIDRNTPLQEIQTIINPPPVPRRRKGNEPMSRPSSKVTHDISDLEVKNDSTSDSIHSCPYHDGETHYKTSLNDSRPPSHLSTTDILKSLEYLNLDDQGNLIKPPEIIALLPKSVQEMDEEYADINSSLERRSFKLNLVDNNLDDDDVSVDKELQALDYLTSLESEVSYSNSINCENKVGDNFSVTSLKSNQDMRFKQGEMKRWGSWEKLDQPPTPPSVSPPIEEFIDEDLQEVSILESTNQHSYETNKDSIVEISQETDKPQLEETMINVDDMKSVPTESRISENIEKLSKQPDEIFLDDEISSKSKKMVIMETARNDLISNVQTDVCESDSNTLLVPNISHGVIGEQLEAEIPSTIGLQLTHNKLESKDTIDNVQNSINTTTTMKIEEVGSNILCMEKRSSQSFTDLTVSKEYLSDMDKYIDYRQSPQDSGNSSDISEKSKLDEEISNEDLISIVQPDKIDYETDEWQLPSPPKAFKDTTSDKLSEQPVDTPAATVISHELLEKLRHIEEQQNEHIEEYVENNPLSENCSTISEDRPLLTNLSLENLEKRKSLVYNRELATSLKLTFDSSSSPPLSTNYQPEHDFPKNLGKLEKTVEEYRNANQPDIEHKSKIRPTITESSLPNFKITTYDEPKRKIKVFEDDTVRSNSDSTQKTTNLGTSNLEQNKSNGRSMENISVWQSDREEVIRRPSDVGSRFYRPKSEQPRRSVNRSESFSMEQNEWSPSKPVTRSKSQVAYKRESISDKSFKPDNMLKSSSLFDVSGLQSLEVMRKIQNKLNTPTASTETLSKTENVKTEVTSRKVQYTGPPSVNMSTWSERPKIPVSVKEDEDYKLGRGRNKTHSSVMINSSSGQPIENSVKIKHTTADSSYSFSNNTETKSVTIKINGSEPISTEKNGNVLIKIRQPSSKFHEFNSDILYRHPTNGLNGSSQRPHSVAFPSDFDISRVPVVRSVELKKSFRDTSNNSSNNMSNQSKVNYIRNGYTAFSKYPSNENLAKSNQFSETISKPVFRAKSFLHPVVKGFRTLEKTNGNNGENIKTRNSWQPNSSMTMPNNVSNRQTYVTNQNVPFSKFSLRKTESKKVIDDERTDISQNSPNCIKVNTSGANETKYRESNGNIQHPTEIEHVTSRCKQGKPHVVGAPVPPQMPKVVHKKICNRQFVPVVNPRDELLKSIRDFGGKESLRSIKA